MKILFFIFLLFGFFNVVAQDNLKPITTLEKDSVAIEKKAGLFYEQPLSMTSATGMSILHPGLNLQEINTPLVPEFDFNPGSFVFHPLDFESYYFKTYNPLFSPLSINGKIFSGASYRLNDKLNFGGYSFGASSVLSSPLPNRGMNNCDTRGATMFMEYKVSKNLKIETRVSVSQGGGPGF